MTQVIDLGLLQDAQRLLEKLLDKHGIAWFLARDGKTLMALESSKIDLVVRTALRARERKFKSGHVVPESAVEYCRKQVRRTLIRQVALAMVQTGC